MNDADREIERLQQHVNDLQAGMYINCVYCGHRYGPDDEVPATMADALKEHVEQCPKHPMSALKQIVESLAQRIEDLEDEKQRRIYYQDIVYSVCNALDDMTTRIIVCGTLNAPSTSVQDAIVEVAAELTSLREIAELSKDRPELPPEEIEAQASAHHDAIEAAQAAAAKGKSDG